MTDKNVALSVRITVEMKNKLDELARAANVSVGEQVRRALSEYVNLPKIDTRSPFQQIKDAEKERLRAQASQEISQEE